VRLIDQHFDSFQQVYDERYQAKYGYWRPILEQSATAYLKCGDLDEGFARVRCPECGSQMKVVSFIEPPHSGRDRRYFASLWSMAVSNTEGTT
jgi:hypothetical protein